MIKYANPILCRQIIERMDEISELTETEKHCIRLLCMKEIPYEPTDKIKMWTFEYKFGKCPRCNDEVDSDMQYCEHCGQAIDWMWEDEE